MRLLIFCLTFLVSSCTAVEKNITQSGPSQNQHNSRYTALINEMEARLAPTAVQELRQLIVLTGKSKSNAIAEASLNQRAFQAIEALDWITCLDITDELLALNYASLNGHYAAMVCHLESGETRESQYHESVMNQILEAIWLTGDGESLETAFQAINRAERDAFIEFHGLEFIKYSVARLDGQNYDVVTLYDAQKDDTFEWYFNMSSRPSPNIKDQ